MTTPTNAPRPPDDDTLLLHAYLDGELDPANALAIERRIAADPSLAAEQARTEALRRVLREKLPHESAPPALRARILSALPRRRLPPSPSWAALAASLVLAVALASGSTWFLLRPAVNDYTAEAIVDTHTRALMASQAVDVISSDRHTVKPWFNGRIAQAPRVIDLSQDDFPLVGGRIDVIAGTPVPTLVYRHRAHLISLSAVPAPVHASDAALQSSRNGYNLVRWNEDGITYWAVSDLGAGDLAKFARLFRSAAPDR